MCDYYGGATQCKRAVGETTELCPLRDYICVHLPGITVKVVDVVEKWSNEHPVKTRQSKFLKQFPNAKMWNDENFLKVCPQHLDSTRKCQSICYDCYKEYWSKVIE